MPDTPQNTEMVWSVGSVLTLAFTTGLFTAAFNQTFALVKETWQERRKHRLAGRALALDLVPILTAFAQDCSDRLSWNEYEEQAGDTGAHTAMPVLRDFPADAKWEALRPDLAARIRCLPNRRDEAIRTVAAEACIVGSEEEVAAATRQYVELGHEALTLLRRLHWHADLGPVPRASWADYLRAAHRKRRNGLVRRVWRSLPVYRVRSKAVRLFRRTLKTIGLRRWKSQPPGFFG